MLTVYALVPVGPDEMEWDWIGEYTTKTGAFTEATRLEARGYQVAVVGRHTPSGDLGETRNTEDKYGRFERIIRFPLSRV